MGQDVLDSYEEKITSGEIVSDPAQYEAIEQLVELGKTLETYQSVNNKGFFSIFSGKNNEQAPKGLYLYGSVGRGKTMLMDLFYQHVAFKPKMRIHFHEFMAETHKMIALYRQSHEGDPIPLVGRDLAAKAKLICFDEFHVTDITDAMILGRLFNKLFEEGVVLVATSNSPINQLYKDGLNRQLFEPFIALLEQKVTSLELLSAMDYRQGKLEGKKLYFTPNNASAAEALCILWQNLTGLEEGAPMVIPHKGREILVPEAAMGVARFSFEDLCGAALGAEDYLMLVRHFHTFIIDDVPVMGQNVRDKARRFIHLIDALYDHDICLALSAEAEPDELYPVGDNTFLFERTASRLIEMRSADYVKKGHALAQTNE